MSNKIKLSIDLWEAAYNADWNLACKCIEQGADVNFYHNGRMPIHIVSRHGNDEFMDQLIKAGAEVDAIESDNKETALHIAARNGHSYLIEMLVKSGANINLCNESGETPLYEAVMYGRVDVVQKLIELGANVNLKQDNGNTLMHSAINKIALSAVVAMLEKEDEANDNGRFKMVELLLGSNVDLTIPGKEGQSVIDFINDNPDNKVSKLIKSHLENKMLENAILDDNCANDSMKF